MNTGRYFIFGDIHGCFERLEKMYNLIGKDVQTSDTLLFLGDYIDRGGRSFDTVSFLLCLKKIHHVITLQGNHERMLHDYITGRDNGGVYLFNGGQKTIRDYSRNDNGEFIIPDDHARLLFKSAFFYRGPGFVAVHAGFDPDVLLPEDNTPFTMVWIRERFYRAARRWSETVIFGHTPVYDLHGSWNVYVDDERNIIGLDTGAVYGGRLSCLIWPEKEILQV